MALPKQILVGSTKLVGRMENKPKKKVFNFGVSQNKGADPGIFILGDCWTSAEVWILRFFPFESNNMQPLLFPVSLVLLCHLQR